MSSWRFLPKNGVAGGGGGDGYFDGGVALEVTVLSADSLRLPPSYSPLPRRLRPYVTVSSDAPESACSTAVATAAAAAATVAVEAAATAAAAAAATAAATAATAAVAATAAAAANLVATGGTDGVGPPVQAAAKLS